MCTGKLILIICVTHFVLTLLLVFGRVGLVLLPFSTILFILYVFRVCFSVSLLIASLDWQRISHRKKKILNREFGDSEHVCYVCILFIRSRHCVFALNLGVVFVCSHEILSLSIQHWQVSFHSFIHSSCLSNSIIPIGCTHSINMATY